MSTTTRLIPDVRNNKNLFVPEEILPPWEVAVTQEVTVPTSALRVGVKVDLIGISQNAEMLRNGSMKVTDCLHPHILLARLYFTVTVGDNVDTFCTYLSEPFVQSSEPGIMLLNADAIGSVSAVKNKPLTVLTDIDGVNAAVKLTGTLNLDRGSCIVEDGGMFLYRDFEREGCQRLVGKVEVVGYTLMASRIHH